jgi:hypothetical protein
MQNEDQNLFVSAVPRALDLKTRVFGLELPDVLLLFFYLSASNLVFGGTSLKIPIVWLGTLILAGLLFFVKKGRPDNFLPHLVEYYRTPTILSSGVPDTETPPCREHTEGGAP